MIRETKTLPVYAVRHELLTYVAAESEAEAVEVAKDVWNWSVMHDWDWSKHEPVAARLESDPCELGDPYFDTLKYRLRFPYYETRSLENGFNISGSGPH